MTPAVVHSRQFYRVATLRRGTVDPPEALDERNNLLANAALVEAEAPRRPQWQIDRPFPEQSAGAA